MVSEDSFRKREAAQISGKRYVVQYAFARSIDTTYLFFTWKFDSFLNACSAVESESDLNEIDIVGHRDVDRYTYVYLVIPILLRAEETEP